MITITDLFCGAGGSSTGAIRVPGVEVKLALNHWDKAIETHALNHPQAEHDLADVFEVHPSRYARYRTDVFIASPECRKHSRASLSEKSTKQQRMFVDCNYHPEEIRSRATMWQVVRWAEEFKYRAIILENVNEAHEWAEFSDWLQALKNLGYDGRLLSLNSQFFGVPQSRDRMYGVFWRHGERVPDVDFHPEAYCQRCQTTVAAVQSWKRSARQYGDYGAHGQYWYRCPVCASIVTPALVPAATIIDWTIAAQRIGERAHPLNPRTLERIREGIKRWCAVHRESLPTAFLQGQYGGDHPVHPVDTDPTNTITTQDHHAVLIPAPFFLNTFLRRKMYGIDEPLHTVMASSNHHHLVTPPFVVKRDRSTSVSSALDAPTHTVTAGGNHHYLAIPPMLVPYYSSATSTHVVNEPMRTCTTKDRYGLVTPDDSLDLEQWGYRMLSPQEIQGAMAFPQTYRLVGNKSDKMRLLGNAVTPPVMTWLVERVSAALAG